VVKEKEKKDYAICIVACAPIRIESSDKAEMISQLLYGETCKVILRKRHNWIKIACTYDGYEGWIDPKQLIQITETDYIKLTKRTSYVLDTFGQVGNHKHKINILFGSNLPNYDGMAFAMPHGKLTFTGKATAKDYIIETEDQMVKLCYKHLHAPYLWGGRSVFGIDCSGFTQVIYKIFGYQLPRDAHQQAAHGDAIDFVQLSQTGDLAFFVNDENKVIHVGIVLPNQEIIHASGMIRIDYLDHEGIYNRETKKYTHKLHIIKRVLSLRKAEVE
jgi:gamma-D-glutamyl-L-lysine dipeptidyl-peptidase